MAIAMGSRGAKDAGPSFVELFTPKLVTVMREGYGLAALRADALAGLTVAIVALPLSMAIAIASGATPERGLYTAIVGGFIISALGGSRFQIGGPAGAFIVLVAASVARHGIEGLVLATLLAGVLLLAIGLLRLGTFIKFIPYPVTVGFTAGIAVIIFASQLKDLLGLKLSGPEPGPFLAKLAALKDALPSVNVAATSLALVTIVVIVGLRRLRPGWPGMLVAVVLASLLANLLGLPVETIGTRFGEIPNSLPLPSLPDITWAKVEAVLPDAMGFALLGAIESLLSAVVADGMTGRRHRSNCELVAQGVANIGSALFGGICVTGTIARTATNVRAGARGPVSGMLHSLFLLLFLLIAAPLARYIPLAALAGVLAVVAWGMIETHALVALMRTAWGDAIVLLATFLLTVLRDLTEGIVVGFAIGLLLFLDRMSQAIEVQGGRALVADDRADGAEGKPYDPAEAHATDRDTVVYHISGAFFFGSAATVDAVLDRIGDRHRTLVLDLEGVPFVDSTAATTIAGIASKARRRAGRVVLVGTTREMRRTLIGHGVRPPLVRFKASVEAPAVIAGSR
ncbi:MAG: SulP family inorganic anion transporter [Reyranellaceae bacterium]